MKKLALVNAKVYVEKGIFAEAVYIEDNIIKLVGSSEDIKAAAGAEAKYIDCLGRTVIPGLNDSHQHLCQVGQFLMRCDTMGVSSIDELVERCKKFLEEKPEACRNGFFSMGWNQDLFTDEKRVPDKDDLDRISTEIPVVLPRVCGHIVSVNSKTLELMKVTAETKIEGGTIELGSDGKPNGIFTEAAADWIRKVLPPMDETDFRNVFEAAIEYCLSHGLTSVQSNDAGNNEITIDNVFRIFHDLYSKGRKITRYRHQVCFREPKDFKEYIENGEFKNGVYGDPNFLDLGPLKLFKDGSLGGRTGTMRHEYYDDPGNYGVETTNDETMDEFCRLAAKAGIQVITHVIGDKAVEDVTANYEHVMPEKGKNPLRHALVHCQITDKPLLRRIADDDILIYYQPVFLDYDMHAVISRCGEEMSSTSYAFKTARDYGAHVSYGTDSPVESCNPFPNIYHAVTRMDKNHWPEGGFFPQECVDVATAIDDYTIGSAYAEFKENIKGRIKPGYLADLVVLPKDIFTVDPVEIYDLTPDMTILDGEVVFEK